MRKDSIIIFSLSVLISVGIVGALSYFHYKSNLGQTTPTTSKYQPSASVPNKQPSTNSRRHIRKAPASGRLIYPQKCIDADGNITFTDQPNCADAKPKINFSIVDSVSAPRRQTKPKNRKQSRSYGKSTSGNRVIKPIPGTMVVACKFPIGMARRIEKKSLNLKNDPAESIWKDSYCKWVCEARVENCGNLEEYLNLVNLCPWRPNMSKRACRT